MPRFKDYSYEQSVMLAISFDRQILPGSFEHTLTYLIEHELDLSIFHHGYKNDDNGRPAYDPAILLKIIFLAYSRGITSSRKIEQLCRENILFMAISADSHPHFTTIADFVSSHYEEISALFLQVLMICDEEGLIGREMFAIDGCKLPSNASKEWSGTHEELKKKAKKLDKAARHILKQHQQNDQKNLDEALQQKQQRHAEKLKASSKKITAFLKETQPRKGISGKEVKSNLTDNESAKMNTSHGVIQGYTGVAAVDSKHQVIVAAEAHGQGQEHDLLAPTIEQAHRNLNHKKTAQRQAIKITADSGYHNTTALEYLEENKLDGYIADTGFRSRDPRFHDAKRHKPKSRLKPKERFTNEEFKVDIEKKSCICPAGEAMWLQCADAVIGQGHFMKFQGYQAKCDNCQLRKRCLKSPNQKNARQFSVKLGMTVAHRETSPIERMKRKIDSPEGRQIYSRRLGTVEPVFGNLCEMIGIKRFSLRGKQKVDGQWKLMAIIHNLLKIHRYGASYAT